MIKKLSALVLFTLVMMSTSFSVSSSALAEDGNPNLGACDNYKSRDWDFMVWCSGEFAQWGNCVRAGAEKLKAQCKAQCGGATTGTCYNVCMTAKCENQAQYCAETHCKEAVVDPVPVSTNL